MEIGYARVSTQDQHPALQLDVLHAAGCAKVFVEQASGAQRNRPQLQAALDYARSGDTLVVWKLDRLPRSLKQLIETIELLATRDIGFRCLTEAIETTTTGGRLRRTMNVGFFARPPEKAYVSHISSYRPGGLFRHVLLSQSLKDHVRLAS